MSACKNVVQLIVYPLLKVCFMERELLKLGRFRFLLVIFLNPWSSEGKLSLLQKPSTLGLKGR